MYRRSFVAAAALIAATRGAAAQSPLPPLPPAIDWQDVSGDDGRWRVQLPKGYQLVSVPGADGSTMRQYRSTYVGLGMDFAITDYVRAEAGHPLTDEGAMLRRAQAAVQQRWPGSTILEQSDSSLGRAQGRSFTLAVDRNQGFLSMRVYHLGQRLYQMAALGEMQYRGNPLVLHFLNSLRLGS
jgi:hypothetical protein